MFKIKQSKTFVTMTNYHLKDINLSLEAKGFHSWLLSNDGNWSGNFNDILGFHYGLTQTQVIKILNELQSNGYIEIKGDDYIVNDKPINVSKKDLKPIELNDTANETKAKPNLFTKCLDFINEYTEDEHLRKALTDYLSLRLNPGQDSRLAQYKLQYFNQWRNLLLTLDTMSGDKVRIVEQSYTKQWGKFVDIAPNKTLDNVKSGSYTKEEMESFRKKLEETHKKKELITIDEEIPF